MSTLRNLVTAPSHHVVEGIDGSHGVDARKRHFPNWGVPDATAAAIVGREHRTQAGAALQDATDAVAGRRHAIEKAHMKTLEEHIAAHEKHHHAGPATPAAAAARSASAGLQQLQRRAAALRMPAAASLLHSLVRWVRRARAAIISNAHAAAAAAGGIHLPGLPIRGRAQQRAALAPRAAATPRRGATSGLHLPVMPASMAALPAFPAARRALRRLRLRIARAGFELPSLPSFRNMHLTLPQAPSLQGLRALRHGAPAGPMLAAAVSVGVVSLITLANILGARANLSGLGALLSTPRALQSRGMFPLRLLRAVKDKMPVSNETWYKLLTRPAWAPALSSSATAWNVTRVFVALALYRMLTAATRGRGPLRLKAIKAFGVQMIMGATCALCTLAFRNTAIGLAHHILACFTVAACVAAFGKFDALSGILLLPLAAMIAMETVEQAGVTYAN